MIAGSAVGKVDEAHMYKNKARVCNIEELSCPNSSQRAEDLALKLRILRQRRRDEALATGTPIANSLGELWVMQSYLRPDLLRAAGVEDLGDWGAAFTATVTTVEVNSTGTRLRPVTRVGKFTNLPESGTFIGLLRRRHTRPGAGRPAGARDRATTDHQLAARR